MKLQRFIFISVLVLFASVSRSQTSVNWQPVLISMDGTNGYQGVEMYYATATCNSTEVLLLKIVNTNSYAVKAQWINLIVDKNDKEHFGKTQLTSFKIDSSVTSAGDCNKANALMIKLSDYGVKASDLKTFIGSNFDISK